jgi:hypothetical protein
MPIGIDLMNRPARVSAETPADGQIVLVAQDERRAW